MILSKEKIIEVKKKLNQLIRDGLLTIPELDLRTGIDDAFNEAITLFQYTQELEPDGIYGSLTEYALNKITGNIVETKFSLEDFKGKTSNKDILIFNALNSGMRDKNELAMFLAQLSHESSNFTRLEENLNYRATTLVKVFPKYVKSLAQANDLVSQGKEAIANCIYGGRMGNSPTEGYKYRGRGFIQLTGKDNYVKYANIINQDIINNPDLCLLPNVASIVAIAYWNHTNGLAKAGRDGDVRTATKLINGGYNGLDDRTNLFKQFLKVV